MLLECEQGQEFACAFLKSSHENKTLVSSYLFSGVRGLGKKALALYLARLLNCEEDTFSDTCQCTACRKIMAGIHPDIKIVGDEVADRSIKISDIRELQMWAQFKPFEGKQKVIICREAERLTVEAQNAFLKTLEEPPDQTTIILTAVNPFKLLPTIVSRVHEVRLLPVSQERMAELLRDEYAMADDVYFIIYLAGGSMEIARELIDAGILDERRDMLNNFFNKNMVSFLAQYEKIPYDQLQEKLKNFLAIFSYIMRDMQVFLSEQGGRHDMVINRDYSLQMKEYTQYVTTGVAMSCFKEIRKITHYIESNVNVKMALTSLMVMFGRLERMCQ